MNSSLMDALHAEEQHAPDPREVLDGVARGVRRRRQRGRVLAAVAVLGVLAGSIATVAALRSPPPAQVAAPFVAMPAPEVTYVPVCGWLPADLTPGATCTAARPSGGDAYLAASVASDPAPKLDLAGWQRIEVNGRPGRLVSRPTRTIMLWQLPSGRWAKLEFGRGRPGGANAQPGVEQDTRRIADALTERAEPTLTPHLALTYLPRGYRIDRVTSRDSSAGPRLDRLRAVAGPVRPIAAQEYSTDDGITAEEPAFEADGSFFVSLMGRDLEQNITSEQGWTRIADVQGHPAYTTAPPNGATGDAPTLVGIGIALLDYHGGMLLLTSNGAWIEPMLVQDSLAGGGPLFDELLKVAQGVRWTG